MPDRLCLLTVHAHPDDETISTGGVMARYSAEGAHVVCVTCTGGEHGEIVVPELDTPENRARLADIRREEIHRALAHLGPIDHRWLGYIDSGMMGRPENDAAGSFWQADFDEAVNRLLAVVRGVRPQVMVSYNDYGGYGHPDHIRAALITKAAFERAAQDAQPPLKLYEAAPDFARLDEVRQRAIDRGGESWWQPAEDETDEQRREREEQLARMAAAQGPITTRIDVADYVGAKHAAMREHVTQLAPTFPLVALTPDDWRELMPSESFTLRVSRVGVRIPEDDLFAGVRQQSRG
jgi:N-acetyl-1-D-myo-inositol-2-amino-2-deoxy-alpha-D-glucopyranoside deacetylase